MLSVATTRIAPARIARCNRFALRNGLMRRTRLWSLSSTIARLIRLPTVTPLGSPDRALADGGIVVERGALKW
jgi:hypothetical protein